MLISFALFAFKAYKKEAKEWNETRLEHARSLIRKINYRIKCNEQFLLQNEIKLPLIKFFLYQARHCDIPFVKIMLFTLSMSRFTRKENMSDVTPLFFSEIFCTHTLKKIY